MTETKAILQHEMVGDNVTNQPTFMKRRCLANLGVDVLIEAWDQLIQRVKSRLKHNTSEYVGQVQA